MMPTNAPQQQGQILALHERRGGGQGGRKSRPLKSQILLSVPKYPTFAVTASL